MKTLLLSAVVAAFQVTLFAAQTLRILPVGDSITEGAGGTKAGYRYFLERDLKAAGYTVDYVGDLQNNPCDELLDKDHAGHSGWFLASEGAAYGLSIQDNIGGWLENVAMKDPDVILLHAGTNDASRREPLTYLPDALRAVIATIRAKAPKAHVIVTTVLERKDVQQWGGNLNWDENIDDNYNAAIRGIVAESGDYVHFLDMRAKLTQPDDFASDLLHPNDSGYQKMANAWRTEIEKIFGTRGWTEAAAEAERAAYTCVYEFTPVWEIDGSNPAAIYTVNRAEELKGTAFDRVGYYMELQKSGAEKQWVWVSFKAMTDNLAKIGLPYDYEYEGSVDDMNVFSNVSGVDNLAQITGGRLEFWPHSYGEGVDGLFNYQDVMSYGNYFGTMQIHDVARQKTVFSYSGWKNGSFQAALGIGDCPVSQRKNNDPDWTFAQNVNDFSVKTIRVYAHLASDPAIPVLPKLEDEENEPGDGPGDDGPGADTPVVEDDEFAEPSEGDLTVEESDLMIIQNGTTSTSVEAGKKVKAAAVTTETGAITKMGEGVLEFGTARAMGNAVDYNPQGGLYGFDFLSTGPNVTVYDGSVVIGAPTAIEAADIVTTPSLHFDASAAETLTTVEDGGRTRVSAWSDPISGRTAQGGFVKTFDYGQKVTMPLPWLVANGLNGKPVVDFGSFVQAQNGTKENGEWYCLADYDLSAAGTLRFSDVSVKELFMVVRTNERRKQPSYLGSEYGWVYNFATADNGGTMNFADAGLNNGECRIDGMPVRPVNYVPDQEFHLIALVPQNAIGGISTLALDRHCRIGGMALAELVAYGDTLTVSERRAVEAHLMKKWFNKPHPLAGPAALGNVTFAAGVDQRLKADRDATVGQINATGTLVKSGTGAVTAEGHSDTVTGLMVTGGSLAFASAGSALDVLSEASFHIDPSDASTLVKNGDNVTRVNDVRSTVNRYAETSAQSTAVGPTLVKTEATGLDMLDFGTFSGNGVAPSADTCGMKWNAREQAFTVCMVVQKKEAYGHDSFLLGDTSNYDLHGDNGNLLDAGYASYTVRPGNDTNAKWTLDGQAIANPCTTQWSPGPHVITMTLLDRNPANGVANAGPWVGMFAQDRDCRVGGMRYGEVIVFTKTISDAKVKAIDSYLREKWLGAEKDTSGGYQELKVAGGSTLSYQGDTGLATGATVKLGYKKNAPCPLTFDGDLVLGKNVALAIGSAAQPAKGKVAVLRAQTLTGAEEALKTWTMTLNGQPAKFRYSLEEDGDGVTLYASCGAPGLVILVL